jgi:hypothetical protein
MRFDIAIVHHSSYHSSMNTKLNTWHKNRTKAEENALQNQINKGETTCSAPHSKAFKRPAHQPSIKSQQQNQRAAAPRQAEQANNAKQDGV